MSNFYFEKKVMKTKLKVIKEIVINRCKMKVGDILIPYDYFRVFNINYIKFANLRLTKKFHIPTHLFKNITNGVKSE